MAQVKLNLEPSLRGNLSYKPGEVLKGFAELSLQEAGKYSSIVVSIGGHVLTQIFIDNVLKIGNEEILNKTIHGFHYIQPVEIPIGVYRYEFRYQLPENLPYSFLIRQFGKDSYIDYIIKATLTSPWHLDKEACIHFGIEKELDLNLHPSLRFGQNDEDSLDYCPLLCEKGKILFFASIPVSGFAVGKKIPINITYSNGSNNKVLGTLIKLIQVIELRVGMTILPDVKTEQILVTKLFELDKDNENQDQDKEINARYFIDIPEGIYLSNDHTCNLIKVKYHLEVESSTTSCGVNSCLTLPITIGSKEITNSNLQFIPTAPSYSELDNTFGNFTAPSAPTYMDTLMNNEQSNINQCTVNENVDLPSSSNIPNNITLHIDDLSEIVMDRTVQFIKTENENDLPPSYDDVIEKRKE